jgi:type III restriction enzyme
MAQRIVLGIENTQAFVDTINLAKEQYKKQIVDKISQKRERIAYPKWEIPQIISYNSRYTKTEKPKSIMSPFYTKKPSQPEKLFVELIDNSKKVKWWFKNGESEPKFFAVPYTESDIESAFYVDFIVQFQDGSIGLFDTKSGITAKTAKSKAENLQKYIKEQNSKNRKLWGGIVININDSWRYNDQEIYAYNPNDLSNWKVLNI